MKKLFLFILMFLALSCSKETTRNDSKGLHILVKLVWETSPGVYQLVTKELYGISNIKNLSGKYAQFYVKPWRNGTKLESLEVNFKFLQIENGVYVPGNHLSLVAATLYAHMQELAEFDKKMGIEKVNMWPRSIGLVVAESIIENNAFYHPGTDSMLFVPYTSDRLPLNLNPGVIAHEYFHSIFQNHILKPLIDEYSKKELFLSEEMFLDDHQHIFAEKTHNKNQDANDDVITTCESNKEKKDQDNTKTSYKDCITTYSNPIALKFALVRILSGALNEGFADYWAWAYTKNDDFIYSSLNSITNRSLRVYKKIERSLIYLDKLEEQYHEAKKSDKALMSLRYQLGNEFALIARGLTEVIKNSRNISLDDAQILVGKSLLKSLKNIMGNFLLNNSADVLSEVSNFLNDLVRNLPNPTEAEKSFIQNINFLISKQKAKIK